MLFSLSLVWSLKAKFVDLCFNVIRLVHVFVAISLLTHECSLVLLENYPYYPSFMCLMTKERKVTSQRKYEVVHTYVALYIPLLMFGFTKDFIYAFVSNPKL